MTGTMSAHYTGEEIEVRFEARAERNDYGVPGSPVWYEPVDVVIDTLAILGADCDPKALPAPVRAAIMALSDEVEFTHDYD